MWFQILRCGDDTRFILFQAEGEEICQLEKIVELWLFEDGVEERALSLDRRGGR